MKHRASAGCRIFDIFPGSVTGKATSGGTRGRIPESRKWKTCDTGADGYRNRGKRKTCGTGAAEDRKNDPQGSGRKRKIGKAGNRTPRGERAGAADGLPERRRTKSERKACVGAAPGKNTEKTARRSGRREEGKGTGNREGTVRKAQGQSGKGGEKRKDAARRNGGKRTDGKGLL